MREAVQYEVKAQQRVHSLGHERKMVAALLLLGTKIQWPSVEGEHKSLLLIAFQEVRRGRH